MGNSSSSLDDGSSTFKPNAVDISHFKLQQVIGKGGFGVVRIVQKRDTKEKFALKYINKKKCIKKQSVRNIFRERIILEKCNHPFIINLQFAFQDDEHMFMILDLATGGDLRFHLVRVGVLPEQTVKIYAAEITLALEYLHSNSILHRDLKPENLLITEDGHIHITDFNVAIMLNEKIPTSKSGTTSYMAPEMFMHKPYTFSVDWWALGVILYECAYNSHPFQRNKSISVQKAIMSSPVQFPAPFEVQTSRYPFTESPERTQLITALLEKEPSDRLCCGPGGANEMKEHPWFKGLDWDAVTRKEVIPDFIPDPDQNNYDFGAALEELLYESAPLASKPVNKRKAKKNGSNLTPSPKTLWSDENTVNKKNEAATKFEQEMDYIESYFHPYIQPRHLKKMMDDETQKPLTPKTEKNQPPERSGNRAPVANNTIDRLILPRRESSRGYRVSTRIPNAGEQNNVNEPPTYQIQELYPERTEPANGRIAKASPRPEPRESPRVNDDYVLDSVLDGYAADDRAPPRLQIPPKFNKRPVEIFDSAIKEAELDLQFPDSLEMSPTKRVAKLALSPKPRA